MLISRGFIEEDVFRFQIKRTAARHGLPGVDKYVQQDLFYLTPVCFDGPERFAVFLKNFNFFSGSAEEVDGFVN